MRILVITGSRADYGLLEWPIKTLQEDAFFSVDVFKIWHLTPAQAMDAVTERLSSNRPDVALVLGDRFEIMSAALASHLLRVPIAHIGGGDVTEGSYDDAMRDSISRVAAIHFVTSTSAMARLSHHGYRNIHLVGNPGIDYIRNADWRKERPIAEPYVVVAYYPETIDGTIDLESVEKAIAGRRAVRVKPNPDRGSDQIPGDTFAHHEFLNYLLHCEEFIGNSSAMLYEAPELGIKTRMIGKRQRGRTIPWGDGKASQRIASILKYASL